MKIRIDYVTNSSSSSFVIAFKGLPQIDKETINKYPFLSQYQKFFKEVLFGYEDSFETTKTVVCENALDLQKYFVETYDWTGIQTFEELFNNDDYIKDIYMRCIPYLEKGYKILMKDVGYDDYRTDLFFELAYDGFVILEGER